MNRSHNLLKILASFANFVSTLSLNHAFQYRVYRSPERRSVNKTKNKKKKTLLIYLKMDETLVMVLIDLKFETSLDRNLPSSPVARI